MMLPRRLPHHWCRYRPGDTHAAAALDTLYSRSSLPPDGSTPVTDRLDAQLVQLLRDEPRVGVLEASRRLGVARGTVQARLDRMQARGVVRGFGPDVDPVALGYAVLAFATLEIAQGRGHDVVEHLRDIPEVLEAHTITG